MGATQSSSPPVPYNDYELVITSNKCLGALLATEFHATGKGLHELTSSVEYVVPLDRRLVRNLRYVATIRNKLVHDDDCHGIPERQQYIQAYNDAWEALTLLKRKRIEREQRLAAANAPACIIS